MDPMAELFARAEREGLWFYYSPQDLWFSPEELKRVQAEGWQLRDPRERLADPETKALNDECATLYFRSLLKQGRVASL